MDHFGDLLLDDCLYRLLHSSVWDAAVWDIVLHIDMALLFLPNNNNPTTPSTATRNTASSSSLQPNTPLFLSAKIQQLATTTTNSSSNYHYGPAADTRSSSSTNSSSSSVPLICRERVAVQLLQLHFDALQTRRLRASEATKNKTNTTADVDDGTKARNTTNTFTDGDPFFSFLPETPIIQAFVLLFPTSPQLALLARKLRTQLNALQMAMDVLDIATTVWQSPFCDVWFEKIRLLIHLQSSSSNNHSNNHSHSHSSDVPHLANNIRMLNAITGDRSNTSEAETIEDVTKAAIAVVGTDPESSPLWQSLIDNATLKYKKKLEAFNSTNASHSDNNSNHSSSSTTTAPTVFIELVQSATEVVSLFRTAVTLPIASGSRFYSAYEMFLRGLRLVLKDKEEYFPQAAGGNNNGATSVSSLQNQITALLTVPTSIRVRHEAAVACYQSELCALLQLSSPSAVSTSGTTTGNSSAANFHTGSTTASSLLTAADGVFGSWMSTPVFASCCGNDQEEKLKSLHNTGATGSSSGTGSGNTPTSSSSNFQSYSFVSRHCGERPLRDITATQRCWEILSNLIASRAKNPLLFSSAIDRNAFVLLRAKQRQYLFFRSALAHLEHAQWLLGHCQDLTKAVAACRIGYYHTPTHCTSRPYLQLLGWQCSVVQLIVETSSTSNKAKEGTEPPQGNHSWLQHPQLATLLKPPAIKVPVAVKDDEVAKKKQSQPQQQQSSSASLLIHVELDDFDIIHAASLAAIEQAALQAEIIGLQGMHSQPPASTKARAVKHFRDVGKTAAATGAVSPAYYYHWAHKESTLFDDGKLLGDLVKRATKRAAAISAECATHNIRAQCEVSHLFGSLFNHRGDEDAERACYERALTEMQQALLPKAAAGTTTTTNNTSGGEEQVAVVVPTRTLPQHRHRALPFGCVSSVWNHLRTLVSINHGPSTAHTVEARRARWEEEYFDKHQKTLAVAGCDMLQGTFCEGMSKRHTAVAGNTKVLGSVPPTVKLPAQDSYLLDIAADVGAVAEGPALMRLDKVLMPPVLSTSFSTSGSSSHYRKQPRNPFSSMEQYLPSPLLIRCAVQPSSSSAAAVEKNLQPTLTSKKQHRAEGVVEGTAADTSTTTTTAILSAPAWQPCSLPVNPNPPRPEDNQNNDELCTSRAFKQQPRFTPETPSLVSLQSRSKFASVSQLQSALRGGEFGTAAGAESASTAKVRIPPQLQKLNQLAVGLPKLVEGAQTIQVKWLMQTLRDPKWRSGA